MDEASRIRTVYAIVPDKDGKPQFVGIGSAKVSAHGDLTVTLDAIPSNGKLYMRDMATAPASEGGSDGR